MKKSKLIIPAVGFLLVSIAAAATSTVAWFTSNAVASASISNITAVSVQGDLRVTTDAVTKAATTSPSVWGVQDNTVYSGDYAPNTGISLTFANMRDASYDISGKASYVAKYGSTGSDLTGYEVGTASGAETSKYTGSSNYTYDKFSLIFSTSSPVDRDYYVFWDMTSTVSKLTGGATDYLHSGVRFAYTTTITEESRTCVWAPSYDATTSDTEGAYNKGNTNTALATAAGPKYVKGLTTIDTGMYNNTNCLTSHTKTTTVSPAPTKADLSYLGIVNGSTGNTKTVTVEFITWIEGEDFFTVDSNAGQSFSAAMSFYAIAK